MTRVLLPTVLRSHSDGNRVVEVDGKNVGEAMVDLTTRYPGLREQLLDDRGNLRNFVNVFVNDENIRDRDNQQTALNDRDEILIVPALAGG